MGDFDKGHFEGDGHAHSADDDNAEADFTLPPISKRMSEVELTGDEKEEVARIAEERGISEGAAELLFRNGGL